MVCTGGTGRSMLLMHDERSKIMNSRAFSWADSAVRLAQQPGKLFPLAEVGSPAKPVDAASPTCRAV
jgi:hypothetical protein